MSWSIGGNVPAIGWGFALLSNFTKTRIGEALAL